MLIVSRHEGEKVAIMVPGWPAIWVEVTELLRGRIRLGFQAPKEVKILREELLQPEFDTPTTGYRTKDKMQE